ncbi:hypothetical protein Ptr902_03948 [Pyrenophora tritici-repentis]|nr:hypothetical protein Ptr902_03948 [Pyrenophora tritici-repentis]
MLSKVTSLFFLSTILGSVLAAPMPMATLSHDDLVKHGPFLPECEAICVLGCMFNPACILACTPICAGTAVGGGDDDVIDMDAVNGVIASFADAPA